MKRDKSVLGFTLVEMLLSLALIGTITAIMAPIYVSFKGSKDLEIATQTVVENIRRAKIFAKAGKHDDQWGVYVADKELTFFRGGSYAGRDSNYDETFSIPGTVTLSGMTEIVFAKFSGNPHNMGTLTLTLSDGKKQDITIKQAVLEF